MVTVADLLKSKGIGIFSIPVTATVRDALFLMAEKDVGALPILDNGKLSGIFSERDFSRMLAKENECSLDTSIRDVMTKNLFTVTPATSIESCMQLMTDKHIRHLPVLENDLMVGLVSIGDIVKTVISSQKEFIDQLEKYIGGRW
ncbi:MAG: CBS domain-containing protein [Pelolinea sp.]|nr:CBS domain-containing protein [Pelolinea sp.]